MLASRSATSGSLTAAEQAATVGCQKQQIATARLSGTWVGTVTFEGTIDGTNFHAVSGTLSSANPYTTQVSTATANGLWAFDVTPYKSFRARCSAYTSGTIVVALHTAWRVADPDSRRR